MKTFTSRMLVPPYDLFAHEAAKLGIGAVSLDPDFTVRKHARHALDQQLPSLSKAAAEVAGVTLPKYETASAAERWVNYYGPAAKIPSVSFHRALLPSEVPADFFHNRLVFVGARIGPGFVGEHKDEFRTPSPYSWPEAGGRRPLFMPGIEVQATMCLNLLRGDWLRRWPLSVEAIIVTFAGLALGIGLVRFRPLLTTGLALAAIVLVAATAYLLFRLSPVWFPWLIVAAVQIPVAWLWSLNFNLAQMSRKKRRLEQLAQTDPTNGTP
jgi:CHASE2 domain-containing sensor protein